ncbi:MAG: TrmB family transcriptional regulator [Candidatus Magasanikbacteria bacterium]|uniref:Transcriptional regulator n=1 Tax=Candidatus Magasanikbacteria bacterium CG10_big_fil_rev_8_21_14_0_10_38_6 TaxID=1974647 RepID=A0A2M6P0V4_9BACT|nr:TrmB family transcriptional regulator [Candidatus Magasanikbacteria bacterium]NCS71803.1 TrmB family transcriptional regulator [Candidatus Magasanikbacteria bacterium]PIR77346.1 MAG: transcriptional regulator [Candidatus Magasanikbacteria bacterium CG10_big_fil_rev_8_21_14_0_10_38_6]
MQIETLKKIGFSDKCANIYLALLQLGPSSVRALAEYCDLNRGTTYDALKWLQDHHIVNYYHKDTKQHFVAEHPDKLHNLVKHQTEELDRVDKELNKLIPELVALHHKGGDRPIAKYYSDKELTQILEDILHTCEHAEDPMYRIYSAEGLRKYLYESFPTFSDVRIAKGISVRVIAIGDGGELRGLDERKWLNNKSNTPTYIIIYPGKTAYISLNAQQQAVGVVIENDGVSQTQQVVFDNLWNAL